MPDIQQFYEKLKLFCSSFPENHNTTDNNVVITKKNPDESIGNGKHDSPCIRQHSNKQHDFFSGQISQFESLQEAREIVQQHLTISNFDLVQSILLSRHFVYNNEKIILDLCQTPSSTLDQNGAAKNEEKIDKNLENSKLIMAEEFCVEILQLFRQFCQKMLTIEWCSSLMAENVVKFTTPKPVTWSAFASRNGRRKMEDRHVVLPCLQWAYPDRNIMTSPDRSSYFAVFDGHGGRECANYAACHLLNYIVVNNDLEKIDNFKQRIINGFEQCDLAVLEKCKRENLKSGSTVTCVFIDGNTVYFAWLGDSQAAVFDRDGQCLFITRNHDTKNETECEHVAKNGGVILNILGSLRVNGVLNVTRTLGDQFLKPPLTSEPEIEKFELTENEKYFIVIGSDGLWDGLTVEECGSKLVDYCSHKADMTSLAKNLVKHAEEAGVGDNLTAVVISL